MQSISIRLVSSAELVNISVLGRHGSELVTPVKVYWALWGWALFVCDAVYALGISQPKGYNTDYTDSVIGRMGVVLRLRNLRWI